MIQAVLMWWKLMCFRSGSSDSEPNDDDNDKESKISSGRSTGKGKKGKGSMRVCHIECYCAVADYSHNRCRLAAGQYWSEEDQLQRVQVGLPNSGAGGL